MAHGVASSSAMCVPNFHPDLGCLSLPIFWDGTVFARIGSLFLKSLPERQVASSVNSGWLRKRQRDRKGIYIDRKMSIVQQATKHGNPDAKCVTFHCQLTLMPQRLFEEAGGF